MPAAQLEGFDGAVTFDACKAKVVEISTAYYLLAARHGELAAACTLAEK